VILQGLAEIFPGLPAVCEEATGSPRPATLGPCFALVDPLDGTREFLDGRPEFTVNLAMILGGAAVLGIIAAPALGRVWRGVARIYATIWLVAGLGLAVAGPVLLWALERRVSPLPVLAGAAVIPLVAATLWFVWRERPERALACACMAALLVLVSAYAVVLPNLQAVWLSPRVAAAVAAVRRCPDSVVASSSFGEPSLVFLLGKETRLVTASAAADYLLGHQACGLALIGSKDAPAFLERMATGAVTPRRLTEISGINYSTGKKLDLTLYAAR